MRSVVDHDIREHNAVMTVVTDKPVDGDEETSSLVGGNHYTASLVALVRLISGNA